MYRWGSEPGGGEGEKYSNRAALVLDSTPDESEVKSPPMKCRNWDTLGICGVGASGSNITMTQLVALDMLAEVLLLLLPNMN
jgi:hypothetical protein